MNPILRKSFCFAVRRIQKYTDSFQAFKFEKVWLTETFQTFRSHQLTTGVPHGSVLAPFLFSVYTISLCPVIKALGFSYYFCAALPLFSTWWLHHHQSLNCQPPPELQHSSQLTQNILVPHLTDLTNTFLWFAYNRKIPFILFILSLTSLTLLLTWPCKLLLVLFSVLKKMFNGKYF